MWFLSNTITSAIPSGVLHHVLGQQVRFFEPAHHPAVQAQGLCSIGSEPISIFGEGEAVDKHKPGQQALHLRQILYEMSNEHAVLSSAKLSI